MLRLLISFVLSSFVTFGLFFIMQMIIFQDKNMLKNNEEYNFVDFIRLKPSTPEPKKEKEKKVIEKKEKIMPKAVSVSPKQSHQNKMPQIKNYNIDVPRNFSNTLSLKDISVEQSKNTNAEPAGFSTDIIPVFTIPPNYPLSAKRRNIQGYVILNFIIDKQGNVREIVIKDSKPKGVFDDAAKKAIAKWKFKPKFDGDKAIEQLAEQKMDFKLR